MSPLIPLARIAWRNLWRNRLRTSITLVALAASMAMVMLYAALLEGMTRQMSAMATQLVSGQLQIERQGWLEREDLYATLPWSWLSQLEVSHPDLRFAPRLEAAALASHGERSVGVVLRGIDLVRESQVTRLANHVRYGDWRLVSATSDYPAHVAVGARLAEDLQLTIGSELILLTQAAEGSIGHDLFQVAAIMRPMTPEFDRSGVMLPLAALQSLIALESGLHTIAVARVSEGDVLGSVAARLTTTLHTLATTSPLDLEGGEVVVRDWQQINPSLAQMIAMSRGMVLWVGVIIVGLAAMGVVNTLLMAIHERRHEFGILLALGMRRHWLLIMVELETLFLALLALMLGGAIGSGAAIWLQQRGIDFSNALPDGYDWAGMAFEPVMRGHFTLGQLGEAGLLTLSVALLATLLPAWRAVVAAPASLIR
jgi:putative ABC transport system permease protein